MKAELPPGSLAVGPGVEARARVIRRGEEVTVVAWGWMVHRALAAAELLAGEGLSVEVIDLRVLAPLDEETVLARSEEHTSELQSQ